MDFSKTNAAFGLKVGKMRLIELMALSEESKSMSYSEKSENIIDSYILNSFSYLSPI